MNAIELAEGINSPHNACCYREKCRQQQAEIEALKQIIDANNLNQNIGQFVKPTNEPVAWMEYIQGEEWEVWFVEPTDLPDGHTYEPLYTHPVEEQDESFDRTASHMAGEYVSYPVKEQLTEWEIKECWEEATEMQEHFCSQYFDFAQLILRKAQEK